jgi:hypothetical protein
MSAMLAVTVADEPDGFDEGCPRASGQFRLDHGHSVFRRRRKHLRCWSPDGHIDEAYLFAPNTSVLPKLVSANANLSFGWVVRKPRSSRTDGLVIGWRGYDMDFAIEHIDP